MKSVYKVEKEGTGSGKPKNKVTVVKCEEVSAPVNWINNLNIKNYFDTFKFY